MEKRWLCENSGYESGSVSARHAPDAWRSGASEGARIWRCSGWGEKPVAMGFLDEAYFRGLALF